MHEHTLKRLIEAQSAREALVLVSPLSGGDQELVEEDASANHPLAESLAEVLRTGRSRVIEHAGNEIFLQACVPAVRLVITGASHIAQVLVRLASEMDIAGIVIDPRTAFATKERFPDCELIPEWPGEALENFTLDRRTAVAALAHVPDIDDEALVAALNSNCFYVGALGSNKSHAKRIGRLKDKGIADDRIARIHAPIGLDIGSSTPNEIALSIIAQIVSELRARTNA